MRPRTLAVCALIVLSLALAAGCVASDSASVVDAFGPLESAPGRYTPVIESFESAASSGGVASLLAPSPTPNGDLASSSAKASAALESYDKELGAASAALRAYHPSDDGGRQARASLQDALDQCTRVRNAWQRELDNPGNATGCYRFWDQAESDISTAKSDLAQ